MLKDTPPSRADGAEALDFRRWHRPGAVLSVAGRVMCFNATTFERPPGW